MPDSTNNLQPNMVKASFSLPVGGGQLRASAQLPVGRTTLTELLPIVRNLEGAIIGRVSEEAQAVGTPISCHAGCAACCRQMVPVSMFEAEALTRWMATLPEEARADIESRFHRALSALRDAGVIEKILEPNWPLEEGFATDVAISYFRAHVACPFLENENCGIYPIRPLACREYMVTSPAALCQDPAKNAVHGVQLPLKLSHVLYAFGRKKEHDTRGWIPLVFLLAWARSGTTPGDWVAGTGEEVLRKFLEQTAAVVNEERERTPEPAA
jgi:Fe-S-cluster containining protein